MQVWPGDANNDRHADNADLLNIGLGYGTTGAARSGASNAWVGQTATDWVDTFLTGVNYKFSDCNGDGVIDANDTLPLSMNFGLVHPKTNEYNWTWRSGAPALTIHYSKDTVVAGDTLIVSLLLGDSLTTVSNIYGLSFTYNYDPLVLGYYYRLFPFPKLVDGK